MKRRLPLGALLIVLSIPSHSWAQETTAPSAAHNELKPDPAAAPGDGTDTPLTFTLGNGLQVVLQPDSRQPRVAISVVYRVGSANDPAGYRGLAHLVEHLMFEGSSTGVSSDFFKSIESAGTTGANGTTSRDFTSYYHELPRASVDLGLWLEASRMAYLLRWLDQKDLDRARIAVIREWESHVESSGREGMQAVASEALYPPSHPYHHAHDDPKGLQAVTLSDAQWFFQTWYAPSNATLALAGDFDPLAARQSIERMFGGIVSPRRPSNPAVHALPAQNGVREIEMVWGSSNRICDTTWLVPPLDGQQTLILEMLSEYITRELQALVDDSEHLTSARAVYYDSALAGEFTLQWVADEKKDSPSESVAIAAILDRVRSGQLDSKLFERARERIRQSFLFGETNLVGRSLHLAHPERSVPAANGPAMAERAAAITVEQLRATAARFLPKNAYLRVCARHQDGAPAFGKIKRDKLFQPAGAR